MPCTGTGPRQLPYVYAMQGKPQSGCHFPGGELYPRRKQGPQPPGVDTEPGKLAIQRQNDRRRPKIDSHQHIRSRPRARRPPPKDHERMLLRAGPQGSRAAIPKRRLPIVQRYQLTIRAEHGMRIAVFRRHVDCIPMNGRIRQRAHRVSRQHIKRGQREGDVSIHGGVWCLRDSAGHGQWRRMHIRPVRPKGRIPGAARDRAGFHAFNRCRACSLHIRRGPLHGKRGGTAPDDFGTQSDLIAKGKQRPGTRSKQQQSRFRDRIR